MTISWRHYTPVSAQKWLSLLILSNAHFVMEMHKNNTKDVKYKTLQDGYLGFAIS